MGLLQLCGWIHYPHQDEKLHDIRPRRVPSWSPPQYDPRSKRYREEYNCGSYRHWTWLPAQGLLPLDPPLRSQAEPVCFAGHGSSIRPEIIRQAGNRDSGDGD